MLDNMKGELVIIAQAITAIGLHHHLCVACTRDFARSVARITYWKVCSTS